MNLKVKLFLYVVLLGALATFASGFYTIFQGASPVAGAPAVGPAGTNTSIVTNTASQTGGTTHLSSAAGPPDAVAGELEEGELPAAVLCEPAA